MSEKPMTRAVARRFLLGAVDDLERQQIESLFIIDPETEESILIAEDELVEDYLEGSLSESDKAKFVEQYAYGPRQRRKLRIVESIQDYGRAEALRDQSGTSFLHQLRSFISLHGPRDRRLYIPIAVAMATVLVVIAVWLVQWNNQRTRDQNLRLAFEQQLKDLNAASGLSEKPSQILSLTLPSVSLRSVNSPAEIKPWPVYRIIELQLLWPHKEEAQSYQAILRRVRDNEKFTIANLSAEKNSAGKVVRLRLPAEHLTPGLYQVSLSGIAGDGTFGTTEEYDFLIGN